MGVFLSRAVRYLFAWRQMKLLMVGLPGAGKKTILAKLNLGKPDEQSKGNLKVLTVGYREVTITAFDVKKENNEKTLPWKDLLRGAQGLVFVLDSTDEGKISDAAYMLQLMLEQDELRDATLLVLANKQDDKQRAMKVYDIAEELELRSLRGRRWYIQGSDAKNGFGIYEGFDWLTSNISPKA